MGEGVESDRTCEGRAASTFLIWQVYHAGSTGWIRVGVGVGVGVSISVSVSVSALQVRRFHTHLTREQCPALLPPDPSRAARGGGGAAAGRAAKEQRGRRA